MSEVESSEKSESLIFMMGQFEATIPTDRQYAKNHIWAKLGAGRSTYRFGFTAYAVRLLQDVYFLDWTIDSGTIVGEKQQIGAIESKKAESDLFAPAAGMLTKFNPELLSDPSAINVDKYESGWLFEMSGVSHSFLSPEQYVSHLESVWEVTQRTIKGQLNE